MRTYLFPLCCFLGFLLPASAADKSTPPTTPTNLKLSADEVHNLIRQLGADDFLLREQAVKSLHAQGLEVLPLLRKGLNNPDPEVRRLLQELIPELETAAVLSPKRVTLDMNNKTLREICDEITRQTGYKIQFWGRSTTDLMSLRVTNATFWEAIDAFCEAANMTVQQSYNDEQVRLGQNQQIEPYLSTQGAFRFVGNSFQQMRYLNLQAQEGQRNETLTFHFTVHSEPKLPLLGVGEIRLDAAYDNERNSLIPPRNAPTPYDEMPVGARGVRWSSGRYSQRTFSMQTSVTLSRVSEKASSIKVLRGAIPVMLLTEQKPVVIADPILKGKGTTKTVDGISISIQKVEEQPNKQLQVEMSITNDNHGGDYSWSNSLYQRIELQDDKGNKMPVFGTRWGGSGGNNVQLTFTFGQNGPNAGNPRTLIFHSWSTLQTMIPFEFTNLPLP